MTPSPPLPLPVRLFRDAMQRQLSLDAYATTLGIGGEELRTLLTVQTHQITPEILAPIAAAYQQDSRQVLLGLRPIVATETFSVWLSRHMEGVTQTSLRTRTQIAAPLLRAFVSGKALPDSDQAERLARALYVDRGEMARVIVADMTNRVEHTRHTPMPEAAAVKMPNTTGKIPPATPVVDTLDTPPPGRARRRRRSTADVADTSSIQATPAESVALPSATPLHSHAPEDAAPVDPPSETPTSDVRAAGRRPRNPKRSSEPLPAAIEEATTATTPEAASELAAVVEEAPATVTLEAARSENSTEGPTASPTPARTRRRRAAPADAPFPADGTTSPALGDQAPSGALAVAPYGPSESTDEGHRDHPVVEAPPSDHAPGTVMSQLVDAPPTSAIVLSETTLHLTPDEVRLIRLWRRLHPHGRRATLQYIGSLLVEE